MLECLAALSVLAAKKAIRRSVRSTKKPNLISATSLTITEGFVSRKEPPIAWAIPMSDNPSYEELEQTVKELEKKLETVCRQTCDALRESDERYRTVVAGSSEGVAIIVGGCLLHANKNFAGIFDFDRPEEVIGKPLSVFVHSNEHQRLAHLSESEQNNGLAPLRCECTGTRKDGSPIRVSVSARAIMYQEKPAFILFLRSVPDKNSAEIAPNESEAKYRNIFENIQDHCCPK